MSGVVRRLILTNCGTAQGFQEPVAQVFNMSMANFGRK